jgi:hypothetical protein
MEFKVFTDSIDVAVIGLTNSGKSTFIGSTFRDHDFARRLFAGNDGGLTKVTTHYEVTVCEEPRVTSIGFNGTRLTKDIQPDAVDEMNNRLKNSIYKEYKIDPVSADKDGKFRTSLGNSLLKLANRMKGDIDLAFKFINSKNSDQLFRYIKIQVPVSDVIARIILKYGFKSITFRDTRGFLDSSLDSIEKKSPTLSDSGLDGVQACIIMNAQDAVMPNLGREAYGEFVETIFKSVPTFIVERNTALTTFLQFFKGKFTNELYEECINNQRIIGYNFHEMHKFLIELGILDKQGNATNQLINAHKRELILPEVLYLKNDDNNDTDDYKLYLFGVEAVLDRLLRSLSEFRELLLKIVNFFEDQKNVTQIKKAFLDIFDEQFYCRVVSGYTNYVSYPGELVRPVTQGYSKVRLLNDLVNGPLLGSLGGITTWDNSKREFRYGATGVFAATSYNVLRLIIDNLDKYDEFVDIIKSIVGTDEKFIQTCIQEVQLCLRYVLFNNFTDVLAHFSGWLIINRREAVSAIEDSRTLWNDDYAKKYGVNAIDTVYLTRIKKSLEKSLPMYRMGTFEYVRFSQLYVACVNVLERFFKCVSNNHDYRDDLQLNNVTI